ncbi:MAG: DegT/DnrJ/EryC1/StrS family aminotransferase [Cyanobacteriota bacterium]|nr:DegT/DnrJ/EryC1/StrS family aminotransferase [Cyanobacteriota bacterium]
MERPLYVTEPSLPPLEALQPYLEQIWSSRRLTNGGPLHAQLEQRLQEWLGVPRLALFANGTLALLTALQALRIRGEVITTPYSFVATSHALRWNGITPVFVDVDSRTGNLDPDRIEAAITPETTAILAVHVYGVPCDVGRIQRIADNYNLRVIYDACHAFGVQDDGGSVLRHGDLAVLSFHATKVFNTFEGGAIVCGDERTKTQIDHLKNFGFVDEVTVAAVGINGKMNELQAAIGLLQLEAIEAQIARRAAIAARYRQELAGIAGLEFLPEPQLRRYNHAYMPVLIGPEAALSRDGLYEALKGCNIYARRYFYPLISEFPMYRQLASAEPTGLPRALALSRQVLCLPMAADLNQQDQDRVIGAMRQLLI